MKRSFRRRLLLRAVIASCALSAAMAVPPVKLAPAQSRVPQLAVPELPVPPTIDGKVNDDEWKLAARFTGFAFQKYPYALPEAMQPFVRAGYDSENLYLALESPIPPGGLNRKAGTQRDDASAIESQDHWELTFMQNSRTADEVFAIKINSQGVLSDQKLPSTIREMPAGISRHKVGIEWSSEAKAAASEDGKHWFVEIAIPWKALRLGSAPRAGTAFRVMLARARTFSSQDNSACEWNGAHFAFISDQPGIFVLAGKQPVFQVRSLGNLLGGKQCQPSFNLVNPESVARQTRVRFAIESGGETLQEWSEELCVPPGGTLQKQTVPLNLKFPPNRTGRLVIDAKDDKGGLLYFAQIQSTGLTPAFYRRLCDKPYGTWLFDDPAASTWNLVFDYNPYFKNASVSVDGSASYLPPEIREAVSARVSLLSQPDRRIVRDDSIPIRKQAGSLVWSGIDLPAGDYVLNGQVFEAHGKSVGPLVGVPYSRKAFAWEHNKLGAEKTVYAPFIPMKWDKTANQLKLWGRTYKPGPFGLLGGIGTTDEVAFSSRTDPVTLEIEWENGRRETASGDWSVVRSEPGEFVFKGQGTCGSIRIKGRSTVDVDGFCATDLELSSPTPIAIHKAQLRIPLPPQTDTYWFYRGRFEVHGGAIGEAPGVLWSNVKAAKGKPAENAFTPVIALGTGDFSVWWFADGDESWILDYHKPSQEVVRENGRLYLRVSLINKPSVLEKPLVASFALGTSPYYPDEKDRRLLQWGGNLRIHDNAGYGYWGTGVDSLAVSKGAEFKLKAAIKTWAEAERQKQLDKVKWLGPREQAAARLKSPVVLYNSGELLGPAMEEYDTYAGEWTGDSHPEFVPEFKDSDFHAQVPWRGGLVQDWRSQPRSLGPANADLTQSVVDCRIWHYAQNMEKLGIDGYWFDNAAIWPGTNVLTNRAYLTPDGTVRGRYPVFARRELNRRLFNIYKAAGREPFYLVGFSTAPQFAQWMWATEGDWYVYSPKTKTMLDNLARSLEYDIDSRPEEIVNAPANALAAFRAQATMRRIKGSIVCNLKENDSTHERASRSVIGLALVHDFGVEAKVYKPPLDKVRKILLDFGAFGDDPIVFTPYWRKPSSLPVDGAGLPVSSYRNPKTGNQLVVALNPGKTECMTAARPESGKWKWSNAETGEVLASPAIPVPSHDYRILLAQPK